MPTLGIVVVCKVLGRRRGGRGCTTTRITPDDDVLNMARDDHHLRAGS